MSCYDVNQLEVGLHSLQLSATSSTSVHNFTHSSMNVDIQLMPQSMVAKQDNQNAAALSAEEGITKLLSRTKYLIAQENGQRRYGPPPDWKGETPLRGCEVFVGKIPRDCFEDELIPIFERIGPIYMFRLMMEFNGTNRGYGFCVYTNREDTKRAIDELNNYEIRKGKMIGVCLSVDNCRLFVGGIPKNKTREEIFIEMLKVTEGVKDVISYPSVADKTKNRGFAFVEYESHKSAAMARRKLMPGRIQLWGQQIAVDWAEPEREVNEDIMSKVKILYVRNLMLSTTEEQLREYFINLAGGDDQKIERVKKISDYAFVHFQDRDIALMCMEKLNGTQIDGSTIEVTWAKPADKGDPTKTQVARSGKQFMDWNLSTDFTNTSNIFLDPTATLLPGNNSGTSFLWPFDNGVSQLVVPGSGNGTSRTGRRNAAGGRSAAAQRERKHPVEKLQQHQSNPLVYWEALDDICKSYGLELPIYTALPVDIIDITTGGKVQLFAGQVTVPSMRMQCITPRYYSTMEEAKVGAAETAIHNLQYSQMQAAISEHPLQTRWNLDPTSNELHSASVLMSPVPPSTTMPTFSQNSSSDSVHRGHNYRERTRNNAFCQTKRTHSSKTDSEFDNGELTTANGKSNLRSVCSSENLRPDSGATTCDTAFSALDEPCPSLNNNNGYGLIDYPFDSMTQHVLHPELGLAGQPQYIYQSNIDGQPIPHLIQPPPSVAPYYGGLTHLASGDNGMQMGMYFNCPSPNKNSNLVYTSPQTGCLQSHDANCYQQMSLNGSYASQVPSSRCNSSSLLPMVLPQGMQQRNMTFPSMSCPSGLYQSTAGSMAGGFSPLIPLSTDENGVPINPMPNIQLPNQLFDYPSHLISNQLATSNLLSCGGLISAGTLIMDPNNINTPSSIIGGANQNTTSCAGPILGHPSSLGDYMPKPSVQNNAINSVIQFNSQSNLGNLLPMLQPITSIQAPVSVAGPANYRLQLSTCVPSAIGQSTLMPVHSSLNSLTTISASNNLISSLNNTSPLSQA